MISRIIMIGAGTITGFMVIILIIFGIIRRNGLFYGEKTKYVLLNILRKISWRDFFESHLRADTGKVLDRPFGSTYHYFFWDRLLFNPVYLTRPPLSLDFEMDIGVVIGPKASRPLHLQIPIIIAGMSYGGALSLRAKIALAKAATIAGTAANSGNGPFLLEERANAARYILQYSRGFWAKAEEYLKQVNMIEINLGQGAWGPAPVRIQGNKVNSELAKRIGTIPGLDILIEARLPEVNNPTDWGNLIKALKEVSGGVPVAVKFGTSHYLERELDLMIAGGIDAVILDGAEGGAHACPPTLLDDMGLPAFPSLCRAVNYFETRQLKGKVSLIIGGGLSTPGDFLKCLALGADGVIIGTIAALTMVHTQITKPIPWEPPTGLIYHGGKEEAKYDPELGAKHFSNYLGSCVAEMRQIARILGKRSFRELSKADLVAIDPLYAAMAGVEYLKDKSKV
jgi:glutamate synthase domain-containing protein 2